MVLRGFSTAQCSSRTVAVSGVRLIFISVFGPFVIRLVPQSA
jgi:hypothetical protein